MDPFWAKDLKRIHNADFRQHDLRLENGIEVIGQISERTLIDEEMGVTQTEKILRSATRYSVGTEIHSDDEHWRIAQVEGIEGDWVHSLSEPMLMPD